MRRIATISSLAALLLVLALPAAAETLEGTVKLGVITKDEDTSDVTAIQETVNIYDGFSVSQVALRGALGGGSTFRLDLEEMNLDSRRGYFNYRLQDRFHLTARYDRRRHLFDADGAVESEREKWMFGARVTPADWLRITGDYSRQTRQGDRLGYGAGFQSWLGDAYDYTFGTGRVEAEARQGARAFAVGFETSSFEDAQVAAADRTGNVFSARANLPCVLWPGKLSHYLRGTLGEQKLDQGGLAYTMSTFQYVGVARPIRPFQLDYRFYGSRVKDDATSLQTDEVRNDFDLTWHHGHGKVFGGFGYFTNDNEKSLTSDDVWRIGTVVGDGKVFKGKVSYASSEKTDTENLTLLKDVEASRLRLSLDVTPGDKATFGVSYIDHDRSFPVIGVESSGFRYAADGGYRLAGLGSLNLTYSYSDDEYHDLAGSFQADNHAVTGRLDIDRFRDLKLSAGLTYLDIGKDLDIEKSILMFAGEYALQDDYFVEVKYNVYNYDDFILLDRYYTANVVWVNVGYKLSID